MPIWDAKTPADGRNVFVREELGSGIVPQSEVFRKKVSEIFKTIKVSTLYRFVGRPLLRCPLRCLSGNAVVVSSQCVCECQALFPVRAGKNLGFFFQRKKLDFLIFF